MAKKPADQDLEIIIAPSQTAYPRDKKAEKEQDKEYNALVRDERIKNVFHWGLVCFLWVAIIVLISVFLVRVTHLIIPECKYWLTEDQLSSIDRIIFSGAIGGLVTNHLNKRINT